MFWVAMAFVGLVLLVGGFVAGRDAAEKSAVLHSDCATAHHMRGRFYYIVPEGRYVKMLADARRPAP